MKIDRSTVTAEAAEDLGAEPGGEDGASGPAESPVQPAGGGPGFTVDCTLPAGHPGDHNDSDQPLPGRRVTGDLRDLADAVERISQRFAWTAPDVDRDLTGAPGTIANSRDTLANLATGLDSIASRAARLAAEPRSAALRTPGPRALGDTHTSGPSPDIGVRSPSLEL